ncbi:ATP4A [Symbiodinium sp. CCMP2592]|nr:ATP4A [Symbiodinium sp. CCMP2592]
MLAPSPWPGGAPGGSFRFSPSPAPPAVAQCGPALVPGLRVEAEWVPGRWHCGQVVEVAPDGAVTIRYDDGYLQKNVAHGKVRAAANGPAIASGPLRAGVPPPPPPAVYPWPEDGTAKPGEQVYVGEDEDPCTKKFRKRLSIAVDKGRTEEVQALLLDAHKVGLQGPEVRWARDVLLAAEAAEFRKSAVMLVEDAVESGDYWKLQAAMQAAVGCGLGAEQAPRLKQAMRTHKARSEASRELRRAAQVRDVPRLRTAIEGALKVHLEEDVVKRARATLRALQARESARKELRRAAEAKDMTRLKAAIIAAEKSFQEKVPEMCGDDPKEKQELDAARAALRTHAMSRLSRLADAEDIESLGKGLQELSGHGVPAEEWQHFEQRHSQLKTRQRCQDKLAQATKARDKDAIVAAMEDAKVVLEQNSEVIEIAQKTVSMLEAEETMAKTRAEVAEELTRSVHGEDQRRLIAALTAADAAGFTSSEVAFARERLRRLRARVGAAQELREAAHSADMYRLRAAITAAKRAEVSESELAGAREALRCLELQADVRRSIEAAVTAKDVELLRRCIEDGKQAGLNRQEVARAQKHLQKLGQSSVGRELAEALQTGDAVRLRAAARAATDAGMTGAEVESAWHRLRELESHSWLRQQLDGALASNDAVRLQAAIKQAELGGLGPPELSAAKRHLDALNARLHARQELHLARTSGNPYALLAAVRQGQEAGLPQHELEVARRSAEAFSGFDTGPDTVPQLSAPPTQPQVQLTAERLEPPTMPPTILGSLYPPPSQCHGGDAGDPGFYQQLQQPARPGVQRQQSWPPIQPVPDSPLSVGVLTPFANSPAKQVPAPHWTAI